MQIFPLSEGAFTIDKTKEFVPFELEQDDLQKRPIGSLLVEIQPFVVVTKKDVLLLDTGLGFFKNNIPQIHYNLLQIGIKPSQITKVLMSHLHKDHAGGLCMKDRFGNYSTAFENAIIYIQKEEYEFAMQTGIPSYLTKELEFLKNTNQVNWLNGNEIIDDYIYFEITSAHSKFHQVITINEDNQIVFFGGDDAPQLQQMKTKFVAKYDYDGKKCTELREHWWQKGRDENWKFLFYHDIKTPVWG